MAAQGPDRESVFCERCFMTSPAGSDACPHCGAPFTYAGGIAGIEATIYPRLAQANLLRMRRQYKNAEDELLGILRQYPHNVSAHVLLGDIAMEKGETDQGIEWYELALDIDPGHAEVQAKLDAAHHQAEEKEVADTAVQLGLPVAKPKIHWVAILIAIGIVAVTVLAYIATRPTGRAGTAEADIDRPIIIPPDPKAQTTGTDGSVPVVPPVNVSPEDQELTKTLAGAETNGAYITSAIYDPSTSGIVATFTVPSDKNERDMAASIGTEAFKVVKDKLGRDISQVTLRAVRDKVVFYGAVVKKTDYDVTTTDDWQTAHKDDQQAFVQAVLTSEAHIDDSKKADTGGASNSRPSGDPAAPKGGTQETPSTTADNGGAPTPGAAGADQKAAQAPSGGNEP